MKGFVLTAIAFLTLDVGQFTAALSKHDIVDKDIQKSKDKSKNDNLKTKEITPGRGINENGKESNGFGINELPMNGYGSARLNEGKRNIRDVAFADMLDFEGLLAKVRAKRGGPPPSSGPSSAVPLSSTAMPATTNSTLITSSTAVTTTSSGMNSSLLSTSSSRSVKTTQGSTGDQNTGGSAKQSGKDCTCRNESCHLGPALTVLFLSVMGNVLFS